MDGPHILPDCGQPINLDDWNWFQMVENVQRDLGSLTERVKHLEETQREQLIILRSLESMMQQARGSYKTIMAIAGASAAAGAIAAKLFAFLLPALPK